MNDTGEDLKHIFKYILWNAQKCKLHEIQHDTTPYNCNKLHYIKFIRVWITTSVRWKHTYCRHRPSAKALEVYLKYIENFESKFDGSRIFGHEDNFLFWTSPRRWKVDYFFLKFLTNLILQALYDYCSGVYYLFLRYRVSKIGTGRDCFLLWLMMCLDMWLLEECVMWVNFLYLLIWVRVITQEKDEWCEFFFFLAWIHVW